MKYLLLEKHVSDPVDMLGIDPEVKARIVLFDEDSDGALCVEDILEADGAWWVVDVILGPGRLEEFLSDGLQIKDGEIKIDLVPDLKFKTREVRVKRVLEKLEAHFKTGLDISRPMDTTKRDNRGRFAPKENKL